MHDSTLHHLAAYGDPDALICRTHTGMDRIAGLGARDERVRQQRVNLQGSRSAFSRPSHSHREAATAVFRKKPPSPTNQSWKTTNLLHENDPLSALILHLLPTCTIPRKTRVLQQTASRSQAKS